MLREALALCRRKWGPGLSATRLRVLAYKFYDCTELCNNAHATEAGSLLYTAVCVDFISLNILYVKYSRRAENLVFCTFFEE